MQQQQLKYNPFNTLHDSNYKYTAQDVHWISKGFFQLYNYIDYIYIPPQQISDDHQILSLIKPFFQKLQDQPMFIPFQIQDQKWVLISLVPSKNLPTILIYFDFLEAKFQELEKTFKKEYENIDFRLNPIRETNSAQLSDDFIALRSEDSFNNQEVTIYNSLSKTCAETTVLRKEFAILYKDAIMRDILQAPPPPWKNLDIKIKAEILKRLQPCSPAQFDLICQDISDLQTEASFLLEQGILKPDVQLVKTILKVGLKINKGCSYKGIPNLSFWTLAQEQMEQSLEPQVFQIIQELLQKYGCCGREKDFDLLKNKTLANLLNEISITYRISKEALEGFYKLLKAKISPNGSQETSVHHYCFGVLKYASEEISFVLKTSEAEKLKMVDKYVNILQKFLTSGGANAKKPTVNLGVFMCKILFEVNKLTTEEINNIQEETLSHNKIVLAKILMLIQDLSQTRNTFRNLKAFSEDIYEHSSESRRSVILANKKNIILAFHFKTKNDSKKFYEKAEYNSGLSLGKIIQDLILTKFRQAHLYILGNECSIQFITEFIKDKLFKTFSIKPERLQIYIFGEIKKPDIHDEVAQRTHMETLTPKDLLHFKQNLSVENNDEKNPQSNISSKKDDRDLIFETNEWALKIQPYLQQPDKAKELLFLAISKGRSDIINYLRNKFPFEIDNLQNYIYLCEALANGYHDILKSNFQQQINFKKLPFLKAGSSDILRTCLLPLDNSRKSAYFAWSNFEKYSQITSFREQILNLNHNPLNLMTIVDYENIIRDLQAKGWSKFALSSTFVSECMRAEEKLHSDQTRLQHLKQFFEVDHPLALYNQAIRHFLGFESDRFEKILEIDSQEPDFIILKILTYLRKATAHFSPLEKRYENLESAKLLLAKIDQTSSEFWYLQGEIWNAQKALTNQAAKSDKEIQECYEKALILNPFMFQAWAQLLNILFRQGRKVSIVQEGCRMLIQETLSLDVQESLYNITEALSTQDYLKELRQKKSEEKAFQVILKEALMLDVKATLQDLLDIMPQKIRKEYEKKLLEEIRPSSEIVNIKKLTQPLDKSHPFFKPIVSIIAKIQQVRQHSQTLCTLTEHFNNQVTRKNRYYDLLNQLTNYYESSIQDFICLGHNSKTANSSSAQVLSENKERLIFKEEASHHLENKLFEQKYGVHQVMSFPPKTDQQIYYKFNPYAPGIEFAAASLYSKILPGLVPETLLLQLSKGNRTSVCQASQGVEGINFAQVVNQPKMVQKIDIKNFSALFISSLLARPGDAKPDNFIMQFNFDQRGILSTELVSIDNDIAFSREIFFNNNNKTIYSDMLNILFLLPQMDRPVSPYIREFLKSQNPAVLVAEWLQDLHQKNLQYQSAGFNKEFLSQARLPIQLPTGTAKRIYQQLQTIKKLLLENENITHQEIFKVICPSIYNFYKTSRDETNIVNSLKSMYAAAGASSLLVRSLYSGDYMIQKQVWKTLSELHMKDKGDFNRVFCQSVQEAAEELLSTLDFRSFDSEKTILEITKKLAGFVENLQLQRVTSSQLDILCQELKIKSLVLIDPVPNLEEHLKLHLKQKYKIEAEIKISNKDEEEEEEVKDIKTLKSIWDLFKIDYDNYPDITDLKKEIMDQINNNFIDINQQDSNGNTALHHAIKIQDQSAVDILLDCGIDHTIKNKNDQGVVDLMDSLGCSDEIRLCVTNKDIDFAWELIKDNKHGQVEKLFKTLCKERVDDFRDAFFARNEDELLNTSFKDRLWKGLALCLIQRVSTITNLGLIHLCINNYEDLDLNVLMALVEKNSNRKEIINYPDQNNNSQLPADLAFNQKKYSMLSYLVNQSAQMTNPDENSTVILKAARWGIRIDETDFENQFDYTKTDQKGNTIFHYMCVHRDKDILKRYPDILSENSKDFEALALQHNFLEWFEFSYKDFSDEKLYDNEGHIFAKGPNKRLTKILQSIFGIKVSIPQAIQGVDLNAKADDKGNTFFQILVKKFIKINQNKFLDIFIELFNEFQIDLNQTFRSDKNTVLHLVAKSGSIDLLNVILDESGQKLKPIKNIFQQTCKDVAEIYGHKECGKAIQDRFFEQKK